MMGTGAEFTVLETGFLKPLGFELCKELCAGEVGFFTAGIKNVRDTQVGDTVTNADKPAEKPLPGYRKVTPMVFSGVYPADGAKYPDLRDALEKLKLNDASLTFEPESSTALGFGFRCGFLGLLHMEIIQERLEREYGLDLITTAPSVVIKYAKPTVPMSISTTRSNTGPDRNRLAEEPFVSASIISPTDYVGNIMELCQDRRGEFKDMKYMTLACRASLRCR